MWHEMRLNCFGNIISEKYLLFGIVYFGLRGCMAFNGVAS